VGVPCPGIAPISGPQLPPCDLVQFPLLHPHRIPAKTTFGMGRLPRAPSHLAAISPRFIPKRNPQEIPGLQNQPQTLRLFRYLSTGESGMNLPLSSWKCAVHCLIYTVAVSATTRQTVHGWQWSVLVFVSHFPVDRWSLADKWLDAINGRSLRDYIANGKKDIPQELD